ncbi:hypothetical protein MMC11_004780 [Xylographa trunciseda]|nr:hypothetical protein [Xylographa trunciseda]
MEVKLIMRQLFDAVSHLYERGIVHRDLKTKNIEPTVNVDLWSLGVIMFMLLTRERPFPDGRSLVRYVKAQMRTPNDIWATEWASKLVPAEAHDLVRQLLVLETLHRITARDASRHLWYGPFALQNYQALESEARFEYYKKLSGFARERLVRERDAAEVAEQKHLFEKEWRKEEKFRRMGV